MLLILDTDDKLREPEEYDSVVKAKIPWHEFEPELYEAVLKTWSMSHVEYWIKTLHVWRMVIIKKDIQKTFAKRHVKEMAHILNTK